MAKDFETQCPTTGDICPARVALSELYLGNEGNVDHDTATEDRVKYNVKNSELVGRAVLKNCQGKTESGTCPTRDEMNASAVRKSLVSVVRSILRRKQTS